MAPVHRHGMKATQASASAAGIWNIKDMISGIITQSCYRSLIEEQNMGDLFCMQLVMSKLIGYVIILGAVFVKVPQIFKIYRSKSGQGLEVLMYLLENIGYTIVMAYNLHHNYPFSTWGENLFLKIQGIVIMYLISDFNDTINKFAFVGSVFYLPFSVYLLHPGIITYSALEILFKCTIPIFAASKLPQIYRNYKNGHTGQLAFLTCLLNFGGGVARIFTSLQEVNDEIVLYGALSGAIMNGILLFQMIYYWSATNRLTHAQRVKKTK